MAKRYLITESQYKEVLNHLQISEEEIEEKPEVSDEDDKDEKE